MNIIRRLRYRFILLAACSIIVIITIALSLVNGCAYYAMKSNIMDTLTTISENNGEVPMPPRVSGASSSNSVLPDDTKPQDTPEFRYQTRYYSIHLNRQNEITQVNIKNIAAFSREEAISFAETVLNSKDTSGFIQKGKVHYSFLRTDYPDGSHLIVIEDCTREFAAIHTFHRYSLVFGVGCILVFILVFAVFSNHIIQPFVKNLEGQKRFITNASHELKTPISIISVNAEALEMINGKNEWTQGIRKQVKRMTNLINHLILLSKAGENGQIPIHKEQFNPSEPIQSSVEEFKPLAKEKNISIETDLPGDIKIFTDKKYLADVLHILLDNAVKYCDPKGTIHVQIKKPDHLGKAQLIISNDYAEGKGKDFSRLFERFYRTDESHNSQKGGFGIGLSIASELTRVIGGSIAVKYKNNQISFIVSF